ncbi:MAG: hypothetical protein MK078_16305 [Crocinitomicaceae bacterium]|nr:hypothetical protein [Crocinitomicaceae bacterium]
MQKALITALLSAPFFLFQSCQSNENESPELVVEDEVDTISIVEEPEQESTPSGPEDPDLFNHYYNICQEEDTSKWVDGVKIIQAYDHYPEAAYEDSFEWYVQEFKVCSDTLLILDLESFMEGLIVNYDVHINSQGLITNFELISERLEPTEEGI